MTLILKEYEVCPHFNVCLHLKEHQMIYRGADEKRANVFICMFVDEILIGEKYKYDNQM